MRPTAATMSVVGLVLVVAALSFEHDRLPVKPSQRRRADADHFGDLPVLQGIARNEDETAAMLTRFENIRTIAVVGSSGSVSFRGRGREIDRHDIVIRVNGAILRGYENDVGWSVPTLWLDGSKGSGMPNSEVCLTTFGPSRW